MKKFRIISFILTIIMAVSLLCSPAMAAEWADISESVATYDAKCKAALLVNDTADVVYYEKNAREKVYPASITKVMTALLVLEAVDRGDMTMDTVVTAGNETWKDIPPDGSTQNIQIGEQMTLKDLLYCLLLPSANEAANILAQQVSGSVSSFVELMNSRAAELGCTNTHFVNPDGIHNNNHYTTCYDLYLIAKKAMENKTFREIVSTDEYTVPATNMSEERHFYNTNGLLTPKKYKGYVYDSCIGIKTGSTNAAGYCLLSAAEQDGTMLISVVMGAETVVDAAGTHREQFSESARLLKWGFSNFSVHSILDDKDPVTEVKVTLGVDADSVLVAPGENLQALLPNDISTEDFTTKWEVVDSVAAPVKKGDSLGKMTVYLKDEPYGEVDLVALGDVEQSGFLAKQKAIEDFLNSYLFKATLAVIVLAAVIIVLRSTVFRPKRTAGAYRGSRRNKDEFKGGSTPKSYNGAPRSSGGFKGVSSPKRYHGKRTKK